MKPLNKLIGSLTGLNNAIRRYPITIIFLISSIVVNGMIIEETNQMISKKLLVAFIIGAFLATVAQAIYERFFQTTAKRWLLYGLAVVLTGGYYLNIISIAELGLDIVVKTAVISFALLIGFIWIPSIKKEISFNNTFMAAFKSFFVALFYGLVIFIGTSIILGVSDLLLFKVYETVYGHAANIVFLLFFPLYFLSLVPEYAKEEEERIKTVVGCPRFLEILISYIIIPLISVFTMILIIYIIINLGGNFWSENLIEPMLVTYSIIVIIVSILSTNLKNKFAVIFKKIFPKVLIPLVLFQVVASILKIGDMGVTHGRYYVIMYGIFAIIAGFVFSFMKPSKTGIIAVAFICLSILSTIPWIDAFSVSRNNQIGTLESVLLKNDMLENNRIVPRDDIDEQDKIIITNTANYLWRMNYSDEIVWLGAGFEYYEDFENVFGFSIYNLAGAEEAYSIYNRDETEAIDVGGYDFFTQMNIYINEMEKSENTVHKVSLEGVTYTLDYTYEGKIHNIHLKDGLGTKLLIFNIDGIIDEFETMGNVQKTLTTKEASFTEENDKAEVKVIVNHIESYKDSRVDAELNIYCQFYILVNIKD